MISFNPKAIRSSSNVEGGDKGMKPDNFVPSKKRGSKNVEGGEGGNTNIDTTFMNDDGNAKGVKDKVSSEGNKHVNARAMRIRQAIIRNRARQNVRSGARGNRPLRNNIARPVRPTRPARPVVSGARRASGLTAQQRQAIRQAVIKAKALRSSRATNTDSNRLSRPARPLRNNVARPVRPVRPLRNNVTRPVRPVSARVERPVRPLRNNVTRPVRPIRPVVSNRMAGKDTVMKRPDRNRKPANTGRFPGRDNMMGKEGMQRPDLVAQNARLRKELSSVKAAANVEKFAREIAKRNEEVKVSAVAVQLQQSKNVDSLGKFLV